MTNHFVGLEIVIGLLILVIVCDITVSFQFVFPGRLSTAQAVAHMWLLHIFT